MRIPGWLIVILLLSAAAPATAEQLIVGPIAADGELEAVAQSLRLMLSNRIKPGSGRLAVRRGHLPPDKKGVREALTKEGADFAIVGTLRSDSVYLSAELELIPLSGPITRFRVRAPKNRVSSLSSSVAAKIGETVGVRMTVKDADYVDVRPFAMASRELDKGDRARAARLVLAGRRKTARELPAASALTEALLDDPLVPTTAKLSMAATFDLFARADPLIASLPDKEQAAWKSVFEARKRLAQMQPKEALAAVRSARRSNLDDVTLTTAQAAYAAKDKRTLDASLTKLIRAQSVGPAAARWLASLPSSAIPARLRSQLYGKIPDRLISDFPAISTRLRLRAAQGGDQDALGKVIPSLLNKPDRAAATLLLSKQTGEASKLKLVDLAVSAGKLDLAAERLELALEANPEDADLKARKLALGESGATTEILDVPSEAEPAGPSKLKLSSADRKAAQQLVPALAAFPGLEGLDSIVIAPMTTSPGAIWSPRWVRPSRMSNGLSVALGSAPYAASVRQGPSIDEKELSQPRLAALVEEYGAKGALLYRLEAAGGDAKIRLILFVAGAEDADIYETTIDGEASGLVYLNPWILRLGILLGGMLVLGFGFGFLRGTGRVVVKAKLANSKAEYLSLMVSRSRSRPAIKNKDSYLKQLKSQGFKKGRLFATSVPKNHEFPRVPSGKRWVHLYGVVDEGNEMVVIGESQRVVIPRNGTVNVVFDLVPDRVEYRLQIMGADSPLDNAEVWLEGEDRSKAVRTDNKGQATIWGPVGVGTIHICSGTDEVGIQVHAASTKRQDKNINFERELRMAQLSDGIEIEGHAPRDKNKLNLSFASPGKSNGDPEVPDALGFADAIEVNAAATGPEKSATVSLSDSGTPKVAVAATMAQPASSGGGISGLSRYKASKELGSGAMGVVMLANDMVLDRTVALKVMSKEVQSHPSASRMFLQEAKALASLNHPNIVTVYDQGTDKGQMYIVMEFVEGKTLEDRLEEQGQLPLLEAIAVTAQLGEALEFAHERKVIHRDIKPANIFLDSRNRVKLGDFGLARVMKEAMIKQTEIKGTPLYMSPEQILGRDIDGRADIYAVGCTFYEMLTGRPPFIEGEILYHHMHSDPDAPSAYDPSVPPAVDDLVMRCLAKDKAARPESAAALVSELRALLP